MRITFITILSFFLLLMACSSGEKLMIDNDINITQAEYIHWRDAPATQSGVPERGTDLELIAESWPEEAEPRHIIYRKMRSFPAEITDTTETRVVIFARIIRSSAVLEQTSDRVELSDRLVFTTADGKTKYVEIDEWSRMEN